MQSPLNPTRAQVIKWLRINLGLTMVVMSAVSSGIGGLVVGTVRVSRFDFRLETAEASLKVQSEQIEAQQATTPLTVERRLRLAIDLGEIRGRLQLLEAQQKFIGDFIHDNVGLQSHPPPAQRAGR